MCFNLGNDATSIDNDLKKLKGDKRLTHSKIQIKVKYFKGSEQQLQVKYRS